MNSRYIIKNFMEVAIIDISKIKNLFIESKLDSYVKGMNYLIIGILFLILFLIVITLIGSTKNK